MTDACVPPIGRVIVLLGGESAEREISIRSGNAVAEALQSAGYKVERVDPARTALDRIDWRPDDVCFLALHGAAGEDGRVQQWLQDHGLRYTGSGPEASRRAMHKSAAKAIWTELGLPTPPWLCVAAGEPPQQWLAAALSLGGPVVVKPDDQGSSIGLRLAAGREEIVAAVAHASQFGPAVLVERFVPGREITATLLGQTPLPLVEIESADSVFDYQAKYASSATRYRLPAPLEPMIADDVIETALAAAEALGVEGLSRVDLRLDPAGRPWLLEVNTTPGMTARSLAPLAAQAAGLSLPQLCDRLVREAVAVSRPRDGGEVRFERVSRAPRSPDIGHSASGTQSPARLRPAQ